MKFIWMTEKCGLGKRMQSFSLRQFMENKKKLSPPKETGQLITLQIKCINTWLIFISCKPTKYWALLCHDSYMQHAASNIIATCMHTPIHTYT